MRIEKTLPELIRDAKCDLSNPKTMLHDVVHTVSKSIINKRTQKPWHVFDLTGIKNETMLDICQTMVDDFPFKSMVTNHAHWMTSGQKLFRISDDFFDIFSKVSLGNIQANALPDDLCGYCMLPKKIEDQSGDSYDGFYFYSGPGKKYLGAEDWTKMMNGLPNREIQNVTKVLNFAWIDNNGHMNYCTMPYNDDQLLKDVFINTKFVVKRPISDEIMQVEQHMQDDGFLPHIRIMCNLLIYLNSGNPDLRQYRNEIKYQSPTSQTPVKKDKSLSQSEFTLVDLKRVHSITRNSLCSRRTGHTDFMVLAEPKRNTCWSREVSKNEVRNFWLKAKAKQRKFIFEKRSAAVLHSRSYRIRNPAYKIDHRTSKLQALFLACRHDMEFHDIHHYKI